MFWKKKPAAPSTSSLPESLDPDSADDIAWIKQSGDPLIWHSAALGILLFRDDSQNFLAWLVEQERMDRTTALAIFLAQSNGKNRLTGGVIPPEQMPEPYRSKQARINHAIDRLCELDTARTWPEHGVGLEAGWEDERAKLLTELGSDPRFPRNMFARPIPRQTARMPYLDLGEAELYSEDYIRQTMPYLLD
ncbi:hypothetical protein C0V72_04270 [Porphyrobacter sp. TH134]|uniref:hypothetical protein n=1 Tax=Porphyrobacter sp. TH134 TaxID=2067450 RepID=UPI000C7CE771|nr:hypothetical protein [Porphyrobacter sp. TH134]PLK24719.1 hypothetical protein C0V72_04270 [Porphyrobacter sp. TH134]